MPRPLTPPLRFRKSSLSVAVSACLLSFGASAIDLAQSPPGTVEPYVRPNVIISIDDSGSMGYRLDKESSTSSSRTTPNADGSWPVDTKRINVLKYALNSIFDPTHSKYDSGLLPDGKIRLAWQIMHNNGKAPDALSVDSGTGSTGAPQIKTNSMKVLEGTHRTNFLSFVNGIIANSGTPSHQMFSQADSYMRRPLSKNGPWSSNPGGNDSKSTEYLGCRRNYHIFMTDGRWNGTASGGSRDDHTKNVTLPDGTPYGTTSAASRPYNKLYHDAHSNTLADWAFRSWSDPLQTASALVGSIKPSVDYNKAPVEESFGADRNGTIAKLDRFWNPRYNPATWPHMVTYTIGFSKMAIEWPGFSSISGGTCTRSDSSICPPTEQVPFGYDGSFPDLVTGAVSWPQMNAENRRSLDLWHAALNGRGRFYAVEKGEDLEKAFRDIFGQINAATDPDFTSSATSGSNISRYDVGRFTAAYEPQNAWKGFLLAHTVKSNGEIEPAAGWGNKNTAELLDARSLNNRLILSWSDERGAGGKEKGGVSFEWATDQTYLSTAQKTWLRTDSTGNVDAEAKGKDRLDYIRGERSKEGNDVTGYTTAKPYRERKSRQGDIVNSVVWYAGPPSASYALKGYSAFTRAQQTREPMVYVGGNDGMLHGFSATNGEERIAYVPKGVIPKLRYLTARDYDSNHRYFVDGSPMTGDVDLNFATASPTSHSPDWRTLLVGTLGLGGRGYFVLDVTNPATSGTGAGFLKGRADSLVVLDRSRSDFEGERNCESYAGTAKAVCEQERIEDADIGHITAQPVVDDSDPLRSTQITLMNNNRWAVVLGNGYNSLNGRPVLLVQYLDGDRELLRIQATNDTKGTGNANDNGLSAPRVLDLNGDGRVDVVYAGDNLGNMWKFDLTSTSEIDWKVAFNGSPLFTATGPASLNSNNRNLPQPITAPPAVRANDRSGQSDLDDPATKYAVGGIMVAFGTGRNIAYNDPEANEVHSLYSVLDNTRYQVIDTTLGPRLQIITTLSGTCTPIPQPDCVPAPRALGTGVSAAKLARQKISELTGTSDGRVDAEVELDKENWAAGYNGWYLDLPAVGERLLKPIEFYDSSNILAVYTQVPAKGSDADPDVESCETIAVDEERQWLTLLNIMDGKRPSIQLIDYNNDGKYGAGDDDVSRVKIAKGAHNLIIQGNKVQDINVKNELELEMARMPEESSRPTWRQLR